MIQLIKTSIPYIVLLGQIILLIGTYGLISKRESLQKFFLKNSLSLGLLASLLALAGSLFYSDVLNYNPCKLCWWQRIFIYPQILILGLALIKKDYKIWKYSILLASVGTFVSINHYILQVTGTSILPCSVIGQNSTSCSKVFVTSFGYITIPLMAATTGGLIIMSMLYARKQAQKPLN